MSETLRRTPLHARHRQEGARMTAFAGFEMPVYYRSIVEEHRAVRRSAGLFDVSHMGEVRLRGRDAAALAQRLFTNDVAGMRDGRVRYGLLCAPDAGVIDDVTLYRETAEEFLFCVNASNIAKDLAWMREVQQREAFGCDVIDESEATVLLAVQGPEAVAIVHRVLDDDLPPPRRWRFRPGAACGVSVCLSRTGYTGEDGYEIYAPATAGEALWDALRGAGGPALQPVGLGARDTLRTEMAYPLYGHELDARRNPLEAGLERFVAFGADFIGEPALRAVREGGSAERLAGLVVEGRSVARPGFPIVTDDGRGTVTSGTFAPSVERSIAIGYVPARCAAAGTGLHVEIRNRLVPCTVTETPFYGRKD